MTWNILKSQIYGFIFVIGLVTIYRYNWEYIASNLELKNNKTHDKELSEEEGIEIQCSVDFLRLLSGIEGEHVKNSSLVGIQIVIRHGHRTPMRRQSVVYGQEICAIALDTANLMSDNQKCLSDEMINRLMLYIRKPPNAICRSSQLTSIGIAQHKMLGLFLSHRYSESIKSANFSFISTLYSRTIISLLSLKSKLLTASCNTSIQTSHSSYFCSHCDECPAMDYYKRYAPNLNYWESNGQTSYIPIRKFFKQHINEGHVEAIFDEVTSHFCFDQKLPMLCDNDTWGKDCLLRRDYDRFFELSLFNYNRRISSINFQRYAYLAAREFLLNAMDNPLSFKIYSGHDITIEVILSALRVKMSARIPYASRVIFEFWKHESIFLFRVLFNGVSVFPTDSDLISVTQFHTYLNDRFRLLFPGVNSSSKACELDYANILLASDTLPNDDTDESHLRSNEYLQDMVI